MSEEQLKPIEHRIGDMWEDASYEWGEACGGPAAHEIFALKIISAMRQELSPEPESVPIPTTVNMARMMLALGHNYLENHAPERLAAATIPASEAGELPPLLACFADQIIAEAEATGWGMRDDGPFVDSVREVIERATHSDELCAALASTRTASEANDRPAIERAAEYLEHYAAYLQEVKLEDIERHPYIPSIQEAAEELRAMLSASAAHSAEGE